MSDVTLSSEDYRALIEDRKRLDYLEDAHVALNECYGTTYGWELIINHNVVRFMAGHCHPRDRFPGIDLNDAVGGNAKAGSCREAIDSSMKGFELKKGRVEEVES